MELQGSPGYGPPQIKGFARDHQGLLGLVSVEGVGVSLSTLSKGLHWRLNNGYLQVHCNHVSALSGLLMGL